MAQIQFYPDVVRSASIGRKRTLFRMFYRERKEKDNEENRNKKMGDFALWYFNGLCIFRLSIG